MQTPPVVTPDEWKKARAELLVKEKEVTRARDALAAIVGATARRRSERGTAATGPAGRRPRVAYFSPLPGRRFGNADYRAHPPAPAAPPPDRRSYLAAYPPPRRLPRRRHRRPAHAQGRHRRGLGQLHLRHGQPRGVPGADDRSVGRPAGGARGGREPRSDAGRAGGDLAGGASCAPARAARGAPGPPPPTPRHHPPTTRSLARPPRRSSPVIVAPPACSRSFFCDCYGNPAVLHLTLRRRRQFCIRATKTPRAASSAPGSP